MEMSSDRCIERNWRLLYREEGSETVAMQPWQRSKEGLNMGILMMLQSRTVALKQHWY